MVLPEIRLVQSAIVLAEELHFSRAADRLNMSQSALSKQIFKLERGLGFQVFKHSHQVAELTEAGRVFIVEAHEVVSHAERAVLSARAVLDGPNEILNIGKSSYTEPILVSTLLSIQLSLFPEMRVKLWSNFSNELARQVTTGALDLAVITGVPHNTLKTFQVLHFTPFDPVHKRTEATVKGGDGKQFFVSKGAPQVILAMSKNADAVKPDVEKAVNEFAGRGFRSLGVCRADEEGNWQFAGVIPMFDPPREQAKATIASARQMGLSIKMVTGDQAAIARETSKQLGLGTNIVDANALGDTKQQPSSQTIAAIEKADGFAEVFPAHKYFIIEALQKSGHIVGMTGDGVNDAPALKKADCGIAVSGATDAARAAASIVLLAPGLSIIIDAIKESRKIFQRMNSYSMYRIAETLRVVLFMTVAILWFNFYPITAVMIVMIALLNDGAILSIAYDNVRYSNKPEAWNMRRVLGVSTVLGVIGVISAFLLFWLGERVFHMDRAHAQTLMYLKLSVAGHLTIFLTRTRGPFWTIKPAKVLWMAVLGTQIVATLIAVYGLFMTPLGWKYAGFVWAYAIVWALFTDRIKLLAYRILDPSALPLLAKKQIDLGPEISKEAYELFQQRAHGESQQDQDWLEAERLIQSKHSELPKTS